MAKLAMSAMRFPPRWVQLRMLSIRKEGKLVGLIRDIQEKRGFSMWPDEMANVFQFAAAANKLAGDFAEVGVFRGASAKLICEAKGERPLRLFDTFEGLPTTGDHDWSFEESQYSESLDAVQKYLQEASYPNVFFYKGLFPETARPVEDKRFAFVHEWKSQGSFSHTISQLPSVSEKLFMIISQISRSRSSNLERASVLL